MEARPGAKTGGARSVLRLAIFGEFSASHPGSEGQESNWRHIKGKSAYRLAGIAVFVFLASSSIFGRQREVTCAEQRFASISPSTASVQRVFRDLIEVPEAEVGQVAICASVRSEGRFITEWLLYVRRPLCL